MQIHTERLKALPLRPKEVWQGALIRLPIPDLGQPALYMPVWLSVAQMTVGKQPQRPSTDDRVYEDSFQALMDFASDPAYAGYRPGHVEVSDEGLAAYLSPRLSGTGIRVEYKPDGLSPLDQMVEHMQHMLAGELENMDEVPDPLPGMLSVEGVTLGQVRSFAEAADEFYRSARWESLSDEDLINVLAPEAPSGMGWCTVLGAGGQTYGLGFYRSREQYEAIHRAESPDAAMTEADSAWSMLFGTQDDMPEEDSELWQDQRLPLAGPDAYPTASMISLTGTCERPDARRLAWIEGLMRVLSRVTDKQLDTGRWQSTVRTALGPMTYKLSLPDMTRGWGWGPAPISMPGPLAMDQMLTNLHRMADKQGLDSPEEIREMMKQFTGKRVPRQSGHTPLELAQDMVFNAYEQVGRRRIGLAKQALKVCPDCADAYVLLAEETGDPDRQIELYTKGMQAGERALGPTTFESDAGHFWGILETRPYMRARLGLARCLEFEDRTDEAIEHYRELLRLNPNDNQGVREMLGICLLNQERDREVIELCERYPDDFLALPLYVRALAQFRLTGDSPAARTALHRAVKANPYVAELLLEEDEPPIYLPEAYSPGSEEEAAICFDEIDEAWLDTPNAIYWLRANRGNPESSDTPEKKYKKRKKHSR